MELGVDPQKIDNALLDFGMPVGPIQLLDDIGLDVALHVADTMESFFAERMKSPKLLKQLVDAEILGRKSGKGIFRYDEANIVLLMVAESYRCLDEGIIDSADDIDFAMIMGTGWAPFRGGPMTYAKAIGESTVKEKLNEFQQKDGIIYEVPSTLS